MLAVAERASSRSPAFFDTQQRRIPVTSFSGGAPPGEKQALAHTRFLH